MQVDQERDKAIKTGLEQLLKYNPDSVPVYIIMNVQNKQELPNEIPIMLSKKELTIRELVNKMHQKYPKYPHVYLFGKDHSNEIQGELSLKQKRKMRGTIANQSSYEGQKIVFLDEQQLQSTVGSAFDRYKSKDNLLVIVVSGNPLPVRPVPKPKIKQCFYIVCVLIFIGLYLYLVLSGESTSASVPVEENSSSL